MDHPNDADVAAVRLLTTAADLALLLGQTLNELVELHLAQLPPIAIASDSATMEPGSEPDPVPPVGSEGGQAEGSTPVLGSSAARTHLGAVRRLELVRRIRAELDRLWPNNPHHQASWLRGYLRPRGHDGISLGGVDDELLISTFDAVRMLVDALREREADGPHVDAVEAMRGAPA